MAKKKRRKFTAKQIKAGFGGKRAKAGLKRRKKTTTRKPTTRKKNTRRKAATKAKRPQATRRKTVAKKTTTKRRRPASRGFVNKNLLRDGVGAVAGLAVAEWGIDNIPIDIVQENPIARIATKAALAFAVNKYGRKVVKSWASPMALGIMASAGLDLWQLIREKTGVGGGVLDTTSSEITQNNLPAGNRGGAYAGVDGYADPEDEEMLAGYEYED